MTKYWSPPVADYWAPMEWYEVHEQNEDGEWVVVRTLHRAGAFNDARKHVARTHGKKARAVQCLVVAEN